MAGSLAHHGLFRRAVGLGRHVGEQEGLGDGAYRRFARLPVLVAQTDAAHPLAAVHLLPQQGPGREGRVAGLPGDDAVPGRVGDAQLAELEVEVAAVLLGDVPAVDEGLEGGQDLVVREDEDLGDGDGVEPALDPAPDGGEEEGRADDEDAVQRLGVVGGGQLRRHLHVALEVPELLDAGAADVDDVSAHGDGDVRVLAVRQLGAEGHVEAGQVLVEGEEAQQARGRLAVGLGVGEGASALFLVGGHRLGVEVGDFVDVQRDAAAISSAGPLGILRRGSKS